jgi:hypothetical protein
MNMYKQAIWRYAAERFDSIASGIEQKLRKLDASGIYGDDHEHNTLWDEYRYEVQEGPHELLEHAWDVTLHPFFNEAIEMLSESEKALLYLASDEADELDEDAENSPSWNEDSLREELARALTDLASSEPAD